MSAIIKAIVEGIVGPLIGNLRRWSEGREARNQLALTGGLQAKLAGQQAQINGLRKVAEIYARKDPGVHDMLADLGLRSSGEDGDQS